MLVDIGKIHPNPYRNFELYPIDEEQVKTLIVSFQDNGDFGILPARRNGSNSSYQIGAGHHRLEVMRRLGFAKADLKVGDYDDDQMIRIMVDENARQMGNNAAALIDSVGAAIQRIAYITLTSEWATSQQLLRSLYDDVRGFESSRGRIEAGQGVGEPAIVRYLDRRISAGKVQTALVTIKQSGLHLAIVKKVQEEVNRVYEEAQREAKEAQEEADRLAEKTRVEAEKRARERAEAEERLHIEAAAWKAKQAEMKREREEAERAEKAAKEAREREIAAQRRGELAAKQKAQEEARAARQKALEEKRKEQEEAQAKADAEGKKIAAALERKRQQTEAQVKQRAESAKRAATAAEQTNGEVRFDAKISSIFKNDYQLEMFRRFVISPAVRKILPESRQYELAEACIEWHRKSPIFPDNMTGKSISDWLNDEFRSFMRGDRANAKKEEDLAFKNSLDLSIRQDYSDLVSALKKIGTALARLSKNYARYPYGLRPEPPSIHLIQALPSAIADLEKVRRLLEGK